MHTGLLHFSSVYIIISESCLLNRKILAVINDTASLHDSARNTHLMHWHHAVSYHIIILQLLTAMFLPQFRLLGNVLLSERFLVRRTYPGSAQKMTTIHFLIMWRGKAPPRILRKYNIIATSGVSTGNGEWSIVGIPT